MTKAPRTKQVIRRRNIFFVISTIMWVGTATFMAIMCLSKLTTPGDVVDKSEAIITITDSAKNTAISMSLTIFIGIIGSIIIKDKIRTFMWMASLVIGSILFKTTGMYIVLALWFLEEYLFHGLYVYYKQKVSINKEIDLRYN